MKIIITGGSGFIGTNLIESFAATDSEIMNLDINPPINEKQNNHWKKCDIMDEQSLSDIFISFQPELVIHLAARTDTDSNCIEDYSVNIKGTENIINTVASCNSIRRFIHTSTQYVYKSPIFPFPENDACFDPYTAYGESKHQSELIVRNAHLECAWTIIRPTNIWGPWHMRYPNELWKIIDRRMYIHPGWHPVIRTYGYVKNICYQIIQISKSDKVLVDKKVFYLGDMPIDSYLWINEFSRQLTGCEITRIPRSLLRVISLCGDILKVMHLKFPLFSKRYFNMIQDYFAPTNVVIHLFGEASTSLTNNVSETIEWLRSAGKSHFSYWAKKQYADPQKARRR